jgi:hypothetical protein
VETRGRTVLRVVSIAAYIGMGSYLTIADARRHGVLLAVPTIVGMLVVVALLGWLMWTRQRFRDRPGVRFWTVAIAFGTLNWADQLTTGRPLWLAAVTAPAAGVVVSGIQWLGGPRTSRRRARKDLPLQDAAPSATAVADR